MTVVIRAEELSKSYRLYDRPLDRFLELFTRRPRHTVFPALEPISFEIAQGESVGLIGQNGAGKSTLLKLLCGVTQPTTGSLETRGTIASILELGTGFHPEFTGKENAVINATILGLSAQEIRQQLPEILEFSELGNFLDQPVKTYSSGMTMRLAFSVAVNVDPDILVIDEALAVGDGHFQKKCIDKIREFQQRQKTIFFCSHALYYITTLCQRTLWLDHGSVSAFGPTVDVVHEYESFLLQQERRDQRDRAPSEDLTVPPVRIRDVRFTDANGTPRTVFGTGEDIHLRVRVESDDPSRQVHLLAGIDRSADQMQCFAIATHLDGLPPLLGRTEYNVVLKMHRVPLVRGDYSLALFVGDEHAMHIFDRKDLSPGFSIAGGRYEVGLLRVDHDWEVDSVPALAHSVEAGGRRG